MGAMPIFCAGNSTFLRCPKCCGDVKPVALKISSTWWMWSRYYASILGTLLLIPWSATNFWCLGLTSPQKLRTPQRKIELPAQKIARRGFDFNIWWIFIQSKCENWKTRQRYHFSWTDVEFFFLRSIYLLSFLSVIRGFYSDYQGKIRFYPYIGRNLN